MLKKAFGDEMMLKLSHLKVDPSPPSRFKALYTACDLSITLYILMRDMCTVVEVYCGAAADCTKDEQVAIAMLFGMKGSQGQSKCSDGSFALAGM